MKRCTAGVPRVSATARLQSCSVGGATCPPPGLLLRLQTPLQFAPHRLPQTHELQRLS